MFDLKAFSWLEDLNIMWSFDYNWFIALFFTPDMTIPYQNWPFYISCIFLKYNNPFNAKKYMNAVSNGFF